MDSSRQQQLRSIRKQEKIALEQELLERKNLMKAEILADLAVIRNNNNIVLGEEISKTASHPSGSIKHRPVKLKRRQASSSYKSSVAANSLTNDGSLSSSNVDFERKSMLSQKRKHWSHEGTLRKSRR